MKTEALRCDYCGGFVNPTTYKCPYCGTQYMKPYTEMSHTIKVVSVPAPFAVYGVERAMGYMEYQDMKELGYPMDEIIRKDMAAEITDAIIPNLTLECSDEDLLRRNQMIFRARLRVVKPDFRF